MLDPDFDEDAPDFEVLMMRINLVYDALENVIPDVFDPGDPDSRTDLLVTVEALYNDVSELVRVTRGIAWQNSVIPKGGFTEL